MCGLTVVIPNAVGGVPLADVLTMKDAIIHRNHDGSIS